MTRVFASHYTFAEAGPDTAPLAPPALTRRMSWMQKAAMEALTHMKAAGFVLPADAPVYFATQFGEVDATLAVAQSILSRELPVSPTAFQHSVHNAVPGYLTIACESRSPSLTVSAGFASLDKLLHWAFHEIRHGLIRSALIVSAAERLTERSFCEALLLSAAPLDAATSWELTATHRSGTRPAYDLLMKTLGSQARQEFHEPHEGVAPAPLRLDRMPAKFHRILTSFCPESSDETGLSPFDAFEAFVSTWSRLA